MVKCFDPVGNHDCQRDNTPSLGDHNIHSLSSHAPPPSANIVIAELHTRTKRARADPGPFVRL